MPSSDDRTEKRGPAQGADDQLLGRLPRLDALLNRAMPAAFDTYRDLQVDGKFDIPEMVLALDRLDSTHRTLANSKVTLVDDTREILVEYTPILQLVTDGNSSLIHHRQQSLDELVSEIEATEPDIVLIDYFLNEGSERVSSESGQDCFTGADVVRRIREREDPESGIIVLGFSADSMFKEFLQAGVNGAVTKHAELNEPLESGDFGPLAEISLRLVGEVVQDLKSRSTPPSRSLSLVGCEGSSADPSLIQSKQASPYFDRVE